MKKKNLKKKLGVGEVGRQGCKKKFEQDWVFEVKLQISFGLDLIINWFGKFGVVVLVW